MIESYTVREELYRTKRRVVYRAVRDSDRAPVIIKSLVIGITSDEDVSAVKREFDILSTLSVEGVPKAYGVVSHANAFDLILEDRGGSTLSEYIGSSSFDLEARLHIAIGIATVLEGIHRQRVVHKDINPANVLVDSTGTVSLIDFSISTRQAEDHHPVTHPTSLEGTLPYVSPEQTGRMNRPLDYRSDFYSLGALLFELFSGRPPFQAVDPMELVHCHMAVPPPQLMEIRQDVSPSLSAVINKLLEKAPEDRYQSAQGIVHDLRSCLDNLQDVAVDFRPGRQDVTDRFSIPNKLYGRHEEVQTLLTAFDRASRGGVELVLVSGYSGIGKSALVNAVHAPVTERRGYFVSGKFDQLRLTVPYSAIVAALSELIRQLLTESDQALVEWKDKLLNALDGSGQLVVDVIPEVKHVIGPQPPVPELDIAESRNRFKLVFQNFVRVFRQSDHPLVIFLDDLQWVDPASLALIDTILTDDDSSNLLLIGAYRDNEVDLSHPLTAAVNALRSEDRVHVSQLSVGPLTPDSLSQLLQDTLHGSRENLDRFQRLVLDKTAGNPFFLRQLLTTLHRKGSLTFDYSSHQWVWDMEELEAMHITNNVIDLMVGRLQELPEATTAAITFASCIGSSFDLATLELILTNPGKDALDHLRPAIDAGLVVSDHDMSNGPSLPSAIAERTRLRFSHDRVQQAAYGMLSEQTKQEVHFQIGSQLQASIPDTAKSERLFEIVNHLNVGNNLVLDQASRGKIAALNLEAARRAVSATAYSAACDYAVAGLGYLPGNSWEGNYELTRDLYRVRVDAEYLCGDFEESQRLISTMLLQLRTPLEKAEVQSALVVQQTLSGHYPQAITIGCDALAMLGVKMPTEDLEKSLRDELGLYLDGMGGRDLQTLLELPEATSREVAVALRLLANLLPLGYISNPPLFCVAAAKMVNLALTHGHTPDSAFGYAFFGVVHGSVLHQYEQGHKFGRLAMALADKYSDASQLCKTTHVFCAFINHWSRHLRDFDPINRRGFQAGLQSGELQFAGYHRYNRALCLFHLGTNLKELMPELEEMVRFSRKTRNQHGTDPAVAVMRATLDLAGDTSEPGSFVVEQISDQEFLDDLTSRNARSAMCHYNVIKSQVLYLYGRMEEAKSCSDQAAAALSFVSGHVANAVHEFYALLIAVAVVEGTEVGAGSEVIEQIKRRLEQLERWAESCPDNFLHKSLLVAAEVARLEGDGWKATELYDRAIQEAGRSGYLQEEALARERAGRFWLGQGRHKVAALYLSEAHHGYQLWGASRKARMMAEEHSGLIAGGAATSRSAGATSMPFLTLISSTGAALDFATVMKASRAISKEVNLESLIGELVRIAVETAGAQRGYLLLSKDGKLLVQTSSTFDRGELRYQPPLQIDAAQDVPAAIVNYVARTKEILAIVDAVEDPRFSADAVVVRLRPRSVLCVPIVNRGDTAGLLYLENNLASGVFTSDRVEILQSLTAQAAISLENAGLYEERKQTENALREALAEVQDLKNRLEQENLYLQEEIKTQHNFEEIVGQGQAIKKVLKAVETVAGTDATVMIMGETGTGKELIARAVHNLSKRKDKALVKVNCAALPSGLIESELFGHEKGAFTGALLRKIGRFELANQGTIFLDEIGDLPLELQAKLLRVLQEGEFERLGSSNTIKVNIRVIAATNRDLETAVTEGKFREDLFYRLNVFPIHMPSLRERKEDIYPLVRYFCKKYGAKMGKKIETVPRKVLASLDAHSWPGNIRELENTIERALITSNGPALEVGEWLPKGGSTPVKGRTLTLEELERVHIVSVLELSGWRVSGEKGAAKILNIKPTTLESRMKKLNISKSQ